MTMIPSLRTGRLILDAFHLLDAEATERMVSEYELSRFTLNIPHPYPKGESLVWIAGHAGEFERGEGVAFAVRLHDQTLVGCVGVRVERRHDRGELGYWIGRPYWGHGYATEAARACVAFAFDHFGLHKVVAVRDPANPASGKVMEKIGMVKEGEKRGQLKKNGVYLDTVEYGLLQTSFIGETSAGV